MTGRGWSVLFLIAYVVLGIGWDIFALWRWGVDATWSRVIKEWATANPVIAFALGCLMGHFFWSQR